MGEESGHESRVGVCMVGAVVHVSGILDVVVASYCKIV